MALLNNITCVKGEIHNVLTQMRLNTRWASAARFHTEIPIHSESPLFRGLKSLHDYLTQQGFHNISDVDTVLYLQPFVEIVEVSFVGVCALVILVSHTCFPPMFVELVSDRWIDNNNNDNDSLHTLVGPSLVLRCRHCTNFCCTVSSHPIQLELLRESI